ncbi:30S ribosomal protein S20 [candidate division KSB1 bacterium]|nr:30S ribosomal protein S20 [candidate division KSB1 bacterium]
MPQHRSAKKRMRTNLKANQRNRQYRSRLRSALKKVRASSDKETAQVELKKAISLLDRLASKGIIHRNRAATHKSKLTQLVNSLT